MTYNKYINTIVKFVLITALLLNGIAFGINSEAQFNTDLMFKRKGTNQCFDSSINSNGSRLETVNCSPTNGNQRFQRQDVGNGNFLIKVRNMCLNINNPRDGSVLNMWNCNPNDNNMKWKMVGSQNNLIRRVGTNYCINAFAPNNGKAPNIWTCDQNDLDQQWDIYNPNGTSAPAPITEWKYDYWIIAMKPKYPWDTGHVFTAISKAPIGTSNWKRNSTFGFWPGSNMTINDQRDVADFDKILEGGNPVNGGKWDYRKINVSESRAWWITETSTNPGSEFGPNCNRHKEIGSGNGDCSSVDFATRQWRKATNGREDWTPKNGSGMWPSDIVDKVGPMSVYFDNGNIWK